MIDFLIDFARENIGKADFLVGLGVGWFGHIIVRRFVFRSIRKIL